MRRVPALLAASLLAACVAGGDPGETDPEGLPPDPTPSGVGTTPSGQTLRLPPPAPSSCVVSDEPPLLDPASAPHGRPLAEVHGGLPRPSDGPDRLRFGVPRGGGPAGLGTAGGAAQRSPLNEGCTDADRDGWCDDAANERRTLWVDKVVALHTQELFHDEIYLVADDVRHPDGDGLRDAWEIGDHGGTITFGTPGTPLATRVRGAAGGRLALVTVEGWEDDFDPLGQWIYDDLLFTTDVDLGAFADGQSFVRHFTGDGYEYEVTFRVTVERFADPTPGGDSDADGDGIRESLEARVNAELGGQLDPTRKDVLVELDWMAGHPLRTEAKRQVVTQYHRNGYHLIVRRDQEIPVDACLTVPDAVALYGRYFGHKDLGAYRWALVSEKIWTKASGVQWGDALFVNDATWWINGWVRPQAGTFIHELGHTMGLTKEMFYLIDGIHSPTYDSAMNYTYQAIWVDYSHDGSGGGQSGWDFDDWAHVDASSALKWSFGLVTSQEKGICQ